MTDYSFRQIETPESLEMRVYAQIRQAIVQGQLQPGERLVLDRLAASLGVSRVPVTQALKRLETQGFIKTLRRGETVVVKLETSDVWELYILRTRLEPLAARYAARCLRPDQLAEIESLAARVALVSGGERSAMDRQFHEAIVNASGMPRLIEMCTHLWELSELYRTALVKELQDPRFADLGASTREHEALLDALRRGDGEEAEAVERAHLERTMEVVFRALGQPKPAGEEGIDALR